MIKVLCRRFHQHLRDLILRVLTVTHDCSIQSFVLLFSILLLVGLGLVGLGDIVIERVVAEVRGV